jgi:hypothetical protein
MTKEELSYTLQDAINQHSLKTVIEVLIDISSLAYENYIEWGWENDRLKSVPIPVVLIPNVSMTSSSGWLVFTPALRLSENLYL